MKVFVLWAAVALGQDAVQWNVLDGEGKPVGRTVDAGAMLKPAGSGWAQQGVVTDLESIAAVAEDTARWIRAGEGCAALADGGLPGARGLGVERTLETLDLLARLAREDMGRPSPRLADPAFIEATFELWRWHPDQAGARAHGLSLPSDRLRVTRYLVSQIDGRATPEGPYQHALYADPGPEARLRYSRPEIIAGAWRGGGARPLVWLTEAGVYEAHMQGTVEVAVPGEVPRRFNVHEHNSRPYKHGRKASAQERYWYFREVDGVYGFGAPESCPAGKVQLRAGAAVAGDVHNIGLGRIVAIEGDDGLYLAVLADTGGAFAPNLHQLDFFGGAFRTHGHLYEATGAIPSEARVGLLVVRRGGPKPRAPGAPAGGLGDVGPQP